MRFQTLHRLLIDKFIKQQALFLRGSVLDIGAKQRRYDNFFPKETRIIACDIKPDKEKGVELCDICSLPYQSGQFDNVLCVEVLQYLKLEQVMVALKEIQRVLKPSGIALITCPFFYKDHQDNLRLSFAYWREVLKEAGFADFSIQKIGNRFTAYYDTIRNSFFKAGLSKPFYLLEAVLAFLAIKLFRLEKIKDDFYSGIVIFAKTHNREFLEN